MQTDNRRSVTPVRPMAAAGVWLMALGTLHGAEAIEAASPATVKPAEVRFEEKQDGIWEDEIGAGFRRSITHFGVVAGAGPGLEVCGSREANHLALAGISYGKMWGDMWGKDRWWRGNWEWRLELLAGSTFSPSAEYFVGFTPHLRYNFATGTRWIPFLDFGTGVSATGVREPNLGGPFQFNTQASLGVNCFLKDNLALSLEGRAMHVSSAGIYQPNNGMNNVLILAGVNWFF